MFIREGEFSRINPVICMLSGYGFSCYQCNSTLDHNCQEFFDHTNPNQALKATHCKMQDAKFCIKVTGLWGGNDNI